MARASKTTGVPERSPAEIEATLKRYGAEAFAYAFDGRRQVATFRAGGRIVRFDVLMPPSDFTHDRAGRSHTAKQAEDAHSATRPWIASSRNRSMVPSKRPGSMCGAIEPGLRPTGQARSRSRCGSDAVCLLRNLENLALTGAPDLEGLVGSCATPVLMPVGTTIRNCHRLLSAV